MSNKITDRIELLATLESCPRHLPVMRACTYADGQACECRRRATSWYWPVLIGLGKIRAMNERVRGSWDVPSQKDQH